MCKMCILQQSSAVQFTELQLLYGTTSSIDTIDSIDTFNVAKFLLATLVALHFTPVSK